MAKANGAATWMVPSDNFQKMDASTHDEMLALHGEFVTVLSSMVGSYARAGNRYAVQWLFQACAVMFQEAELVLDAFEKSNGTKH